MLLSSNLLFSVFMWQNNYETFLKSFGILPTALWGAILYKQKEEWNKFKNCKSQAIIWQSVHSEINAVKAF